MVVEEGVEGKVGVVKAWARSVVTESLVVAKAMMTWITAAAAETVCHCSEISCQQYPALVLAC